MTERGRKALHRASDSLTIGPSEMSWDGQTLSIRVEELTVPFPSSLRGEVRFHPQALTTQRVALDAQGRHRWWPIAPSGRVEVSFDRPGIKWTGEGYLDCNAGDVPLEQDFVRWDWSRAALRHGAAILYDAERRDGSRLSLALRSDGSGMMQEIEPPPAVILPRTAWGIERRTQADAGCEVALLSTLESAPFYARSLLRSGICGESVRAVHESLSLDRFAAPWVQLMLPFRMPRW